jgi:hypothetical protein
MRAPLSTLAPRRERSRRADGDALAAGATGTALQLLPGNGVLPQRNIYSKYPYDWGPIEPGEEVMW